MMLSSLNRPTVTDAFERWTENVAGGSVELQRSIASAGIEMLLSPSSSAVPLRHRLIYAWSEHGLWGAASEDLVLVSTGPSRELAASTIILELQQQPEFAAAEQNLEGLLTVIAEVPPEAAYIAQARAMRAQFTQPRSEGEQSEREAWHALQAAAAARLFAPRG
jgi:hypothetical protein